VGEDLDGRPAEDEPVLGEVAGPGPGVDGLEHAAQEQVRGHEDCPGQQQPQGTLADVRPVAELATAGHRPGEEEAVRMPHFQTYFWTVYSLGLPRTEGLHLQVRDIDAARMAVHVHLGKGAKDRYVPLPSRTLAMLRTHWATHRHPVWLFPAHGRDPRQATAAEGPMPRSSVQKALQRVVQELKFQKAISIHTLRHSYATHLLEAGVNLRLIQQYLGHSSLRTTMIYLYLTSVSHEQAFARIEELMGP
jgi:site-specific recombinase XerD